MASSSLSVRNLHVELKHQSDAHAYLVDDISFDVFEGEAFGIVGESGSGKSLTALSVIGLLPKSLQPTGTIEIDGIRTDTLTERQMRAHRGNLVGMIFQNPFGALNPVFTVASQLLAAIKAHSELTKRLAHDRAVELLHSVGLTDAEMFLARYPHQLSGGQAQRISIAIALAGNPTLLVADEPTTALDVTVQAGIIALLKDLIHSRNLAVVFISHDLAVVSQLCARVGVMKDGRMVESGATKEVITNPAHAYTRQLVASASALSDTSHLLVASGTGGRTQ